MEVIFVSHSGFSFGTSVILLYLTTLFATPVKSNAPNIDYSHNMRILKLPRNTSPGTLIYRLKGSDPDPVRLTFGVKGASGRRMIEVRPAGFNEADVYLKNQLEEKEYKVTLFVSDGRETTEVESTIVVTDSDGVELSPFIRCETLMTVSESSPPNQTVGFVTARERDKSNLAVTFQLRGSDAFTIRYIFGPKGVSRAEIVTTKTLDYERQNLYLLTVIAINGWTNDSLDTRNIATREVAVVVTDVQDTPPKFDNPPPVIWLDGTSRQGSAVANFHAEDGDFGSQRNVSYTLVNAQGPKYFTINSTSGDVYLMRPFEEFKRSQGIGNPYPISIISRELVPDFEEASEAMITSSIKVAIIAVEAVNNPPMFKSPALSGFIEENRPLRSAIVWNLNSLPQVSDLDHGPNGSFTLQLESFTDIFEIYPAEGTNELNFQILTKKAFDYETDATEYKLKITARNLIDSGSTGTASCICIIKLVDLNDNAPVFSETWYKGSLFENSKPNTEVLTIKATDMDSGLFGAVKYTALRGPMADRFHLNPKTGLITLMSDDGIDRETVTNIYLIAEARDMDGVGNSNFTQICIHVLDVNDNKPIFIQKYYDTILSNDRTTFPHPLIVTAVDEDEPGTPNSNVTYEIIAGNFEDKFTINAVTGEISIRQSAAAESLRQRPRRAAMVEQETTTKGFPPSIMLTIRAHDQGIPYQYSLAYVFIYRQNYTHRSVSFLLESSDRVIRENLKAVESALGTITGGDVTIHSVQVLKGPQKVLGNVTVVDASIVYPTEGVIDLRRLNTVAYEITNDKYRTVDAGVDKSSVVYKSSLDVVVWVLLLLIVLTIMFLVCLVSVLCCYYNPKRKKVEDSSQLVTIEKVKEIKHKNGDSYNKEGTTETEAKKIFSQTNEVRERVSSAPEEHRGSSIGVPSTRWHGPRPHRNIRSWKLAERSRRMRVAPDTADENDVYISDVPDLESTQSDDGYYIVDKGVKRGRLGTYNRASHSTTGTYLVDASDTRVHRKPSRYFRTFSDRAPKRTEILYIRSPPQVYNDHIRSVSQNDLLIDEEDTLSTGTVQRHPSTRRRTLTECDPGPDTQRRQVSFMENAETLAVPGAADEAMMIRGKPRKSPSEITLISERILREETEEDQEEGGQEEEEGERREREDKKFIQKCDPHESNNSSVRDPSSNVEPDVVLGANSNESNDKRLSRRASKGTKDEESNRQGIKSSGSENGSSGTKSSTDLETSRDGRREESLHAVSARSEREKSDSDSGIGRSQPDKELTFKNLNLMEKKSIFTIAYEGIKTDRIQSADSIHGSL